MSKFTSEQRKYFKLGNEYLHKNPLFKLKLNIMIDPHDPSAIAKFYRQMNRYTYFANISLIGYITEIKGQRRFTWGNEYDLFPYCQKLIKDLSQVDEEIFIPKGFTFRDNDCEKWFIGKLVELINGIKQKKITVTPELQQTIEDIIHNDLEYSFSFINIDEFDQILLMHTNIRKGREMIKREDVTKFSQYIDDIKKILYKKITGKDELAYIHLIPIKITTNKTNEQIESALESYSIFCRKYCNKIKFTGQILTGNNNIDIIRDSDGKCVTSCNFEWLFGVRHIQENKFLMEKCAFKNCDNLMKSLKNKPTINTSSLIDYIDMLCYANTILQNMRSESLLDKSHTLCTFKCDGGDMLVFGIIYDAY